VGTSYFAGQGHCEKKIMTAKILILLIIPCLLGWLVLQAGLRQSKLPLKNLFMLCAAPVTGFSVISLLLFVCYVFQPQHARLITTLLPWLLILILMACRGFALGSKKESKNSAFNFNDFLPWTPVKILKLGAGVVLTALLAIIFFNFVTRIVHDMTWNPFGGWDARYFWHLKSRFLFREPEHWRLLFSPDLRWGNNDYPLMVPGIITWGWHFLGREALLWPMLISLIFVCSLGGLILWYLAAWTSWISAVTASLFFFTMPAYIFWGGTMYCDIPYAFFSNSALLLLISALRLKDLRILALSAFLAGCSAFTKNEGLVFLGWYGLLAAAAWGWLYRRERPLFFKSMFSLAIGLALPLAVCVYFKTELVSVQANLIGKSSPGEILASLLDWPRNRVILQGFWVYMADAKNWNGLWFLFFAAVLCWPIARKHGMLPYSGVLFAAILLINLGYALIFTITPNNIYKHIQTALMRLLLQTGALALVFVFEVFGFKNSRVKR